MHRPFELLRPAPRDDEHQEFAHARLERAAKAQVLADLLQPVHQLRAAQKRDKRPFDAAARAGRERLGCLTLRFVHRRRLEHRHALYVGHGSSFRLRAMALTTSSAAAIASAALMPPRVGAKALTASGPAI